MDLPNLRVLEVSGLLPRSKSIDLGFEKASSKIRSLSFRQCKLKPEMLINVVETCKALESFRYDLHCLDRGTWDEETIPIGTSALNTALLQHRGSLKSLAITNLANMGELWSEDITSFSTSEFGKLAVLEIDSPLLVGDDLQTFYQAVQDLPLSLRELTLHTYAEVSSLLTVVVQLGPLKTRGLDRIKVTFPTKNDRGEGWLNPHYATIFSADRGMSSKGRQYTVEYESYLGGPRVTFECWELQAWTSSEIEKLVAEVHCAGIDGLIHAQLRDMWEDECVLGEAFLASLEEEELAYDSATGTMMIDFEEALCKLFSESKEDLSSG